MRIDELKPSEIRSWRGQNNPTAMHRALTAKGFEESGSGAYSITYHKPGSNVIVKITRKPYRCWMQFAEFVRKNPNPHFPKIGSIKRLHDEEAYFVVFMEKLEPLSKLKNMDVKEFQWGLFDAHHAMHEHEWEQVLQGDQIIAPDYEGLVKMLDKWPSFVDALNTLYENLPEDCLPDIHRGNVMTRNGVPVVIDPYME
jgi:hypothetical protein